MPAKVVYQTARDGRYVGPAEADESPLEPGVFLIPAGCVEQRPPIPASDKEVPVFVDGKWVLVPVPPEPEPEPVSEPPRVPRITSPREFFARLTKRERSRIRAAARSNDDVADWYDLLRLAGYIDLDDPETIAGVKALVRAGLIGSDREPELLA